MTRKRRLFRDIVMFATAFSLWTTWLPMMRTLSGQNSYAWGVELFDTMYRGVGWSGHYMFLVYAAVLGVTILWMGFRNPRAPFSALLLFWHAVPFLNALYLPLIAGKRNIFYGDTGDVSWDLTWISPLVTGAMFVLAVLWALYEERQANPVETPEWGPRNKRYALVFAVYVMGVTILEWTGSTHGATDMIAVPLNILAPVLIALMFYPWHRADSTKIVTG